MAKIKIKTKKKFFHPSLLIALVIILVLFLGFIFLRKYQKDNFQKKILPLAVKKVINNDKTQFTIGEIKEISGVYEFNLTVNNQKYISYISKDGKILFPSAVKLYAEKNNSPTAQTQGNQTKKLTCKDLTKTKNPNLTAYVVSQCPYGLQMQRVFKAVINEQPELEKYLSIKYIGGVENGKITSMHGDAEAQENLRQICIREEQKNLYWSYFSCYMQAGKSDECLANTGVNTSLLNSCITDKNKGLKYAQADFDSGKKFNVGGSPTLLLNDKQIVSEFDFGGRVANTIKDIVCCGSQTKEDFCQKEISKNELATSFSAVDESGGNTNQNAACGN